MKRIFTLVITLGLLTSVLGIVAAESGAGGAATKPATPESFQIRNKKSGDRCVPKTLTVPLARAVNWRAFQTFAGRSPVLLSVSSSPTSTALPHDWASRGTADGNNGARKFRLIVTNSIKVQKRILVISTEPI